MKTTTRLTFETFPFDEATDAHLVVSLAAPRRPGPAARPPVCVIPVIDVSGSMAGAKLHFAKQAVMKLVDHLAPGDHCGVVVFSTAVETLAAPAEMTQARKDALKGLVGHLAPRHDTNLGGGLLAGLDHARVARLPPGVLVRVILFTDGLANAGPAKSGEEILALLEEHLGEATVSAFGFGDDADQELLRDLAAKGKGNYAYVQGPEDALTAFARELGGLLSTVAQRIEVTVTPREGLVLTDVVSDVDATEERGVVRIRVPDLLADEERTLVLAGRLGPRPAASAGPEVVADVTVAFETFERGRVAAGGHAAEARVRFVPRVEAQGAPTPEVDALVAVAQLVRAQIDAEEAARRGRYAEAGEVMVLFQEAVTARGHEAVADAAGKIGRQVSDAGAYRGSAAYRSSMRRGATRGVTTLYQRDADADLKAMGQAKRTAAQERMERAFGSDERKGRDGGGIRRKRSRRW